MGRHEIFNLSTAISTGLLSGAGSATDEGQSKRDPFADPNRHEGFIPYPPGKPTCFLAIDVAIPLEAERLIELASAEIRRLLPLKSKGLDLAGRLEVQASLEAEYRIRELVAVVTGNSPAKPDEVERTIDVHRAALEAFEAACRASDATAIRLAGGDTSDAAMAPLEATRSETDAAEHAAWDAILALRPAEPGPLARMIRYLATCPDVNGHDADEILEHLAVAAESVAAPQAEREQEQPDPVFVLIEESQAAYEEWTRLEKIECNLPFGPELDVATVATEAAGRRERAAFEAMLSAQPTTLPGLAAFAEYLPKALAQISIDGVEKDAERALRSLATALSDLACNSSRSERDR